MSVYTVRYLLSLGNVAMSLVLGVIAMVLCYVAYPNLMLSLFKAALGLKAWIVSFSSNPQHEIIARTVLHESSIVLMGFTLLSRIVVGMFIAIGARLIHGSGR
ncbi:MAG TPA: hypothetical protein PK970_10605 [Hyphomicrobiaceae bacterium]|nr:hypothetical protein [Hyphomicrobiaceae bacterium]